MRKKFKHQRQCGLSLVEVMIALLIGMIGIIVMMQIYALSEERKRTTTAGGDAQNNAVIVLDSLQREIGQAGYGFALTRLLNCSLQLRSGVILPLAPATINPPAALVAPGDPNTDTLLVAYGAGSDQPDGYTVTATSGSTYTLLRSGILATGDRVIVTSATAPCGTLILDSITARNAAAGTVTLTGASASGGALFSLGATPVFRAYAVRNSSLVMCDYMLNDCSQATPANWQTVADGILSLRAQYGRDTTGTMDGVVDLYDQTTPTNACGWARTAAVRLAVVARSGQFEKDVVSASAPVWQGSADLPIDVSANPDASVNADWGHYRYRVLETLVPIRNISWMGVPTGC